MSDRPYFRHKNVELVTAAQSDRVGVLYELTFRNTPSAKQLRKALESESEPTEAPAVAVMDAPKPKAQTVNLEALQAKAARLKEQAEECFRDRQTNTAKRLAQAMHKRLEGDRLKRQAEILEAYCANPFEGLKTSEIIGKAQEASVYECKNVCNGYHSYNVETSAPRHKDAIHEQLRALLNPETIKANNQKSAQIQAEASLRRCDIPGFFPTPPAVVAAMLEQAGDLRGLTVLEPSAGKGDLMKAAFGLGATVRAYEIVPKLAQYVKDHVGFVQNADFLEQEPVADVDCVLMNPPFEKDAAPKHVLHALKWLKPDGKLIAVMPANWADKSSADPLYAEIESKGLSLLEIEVQSGAFNGADAFRQTGVNTQIIVIAA